MKITRLILAVAAFAGSAALLTAGPGPQYWNRPQAAAKTAPAPATAVTKATTSAPVATACCAACACCQKAT